MTQCYGLLPHNYKKLGFTEWTLEIAEGIHYGNCLFLFTYKGDDTS